MVLAGLSRESRRLFGFFTGSDNRGSVLAYLVPRPSGLLQRVVSMAGGGMCVGSASWLVQGAGVCVNTGSSGVCASSVVVEVHICFCVALAIYVRE